MMVRLFLLRMIIWGNFLFRGGLRVLSTVFVWCYAVLFFKNRIKMIAVRKAEPLHDVRDIHVGISQKASGFFQGKASSVF